VDRDWKLVPGLVGLVSFAPHEPTARPADHDDGPQQRDPAPGFPGDTAGDAAAPGRQQGPDSARAGYGQSTAACWGWGRSHSNSRLASMAPAMPKPTAKMTTWSWSSAGDGLSARCAIRVTGVLLSQISGYGPEAAGVVESTDQFTGDIVGTDLGVLLHCADPGTAQAADGHEVSPSNRRDAGNGARQRPCLARMRPVPPAPGSSGAASIAGTTHKTVKRVIARRWAWGGSPPW
jgi:hypothetical protein